MKYLEKILPYLKYIKPHWRLILLSMLLSLPLAALRAYPVILIQELFDGILIAKNESKLVTVPLLILGVYLINFVLRFFSYFALRVVVTRIDQKMKFDLFLHLMGLSSDYFTTQSSGALISRVGTDPVLVGQGIGQITAVIREPLQLVFLIGYIFNLDWKLSLITIAIFPPLLLIFQISGKAVKRYIRKIQEEQGRMFGTLQESFTGFRMIKSFKLEPYVTQRFYDQSEVFVKHVMKTSVFEETSSPMIELVSAAAVATLIYVGGHQVIQGHLTPGQLTSFFAAFMLMMGPIRNFNDMNLKLNTAAGAYGRINEIFSWKSRLAETPHPIPIEAFKNEIQFTNVHFAYPDEPSREILKGISFQLKKGHSVALVGASGAGKSSLVTLLPRLYDVNAGSICIDGIDIKNLQVAKLRELIAVVSQDVFLFNDTIEENIRCGRLDATSEEIHEAAKQAYAYDFIQAMPQGFKSIIGDRGQKLSGGERQRISIARAFLRKSPILVLDEATSALDSKSEKTVQTALENLMKDRTVIMIAHRLSTIRNADEILVMDHGLIVERGSHNSLVKTNGAYSRMLQLHESQVQS
jgi:subfamily B ATP-binding cassette protein MsbA